MSTVTLNAPEETTERPIQGTLEWLFLSATKADNAGTTVTAPENFDSELYMETTTIMFADVVESVRLIQQNELVNALRIRSLLQTLSKDVVPMHRGNVLERRGDGLLIKFSNADDATVCALALHAAAAAASDGHAPDSVLAFRIGIHVASVIADATAIYGDGINLAARVTSLAGPGETVVTATTRDGLIAGRTVDIEDLGDCYVKNIAEPIRAFRIGLVGDQPVIPLGSSSRQDSLPTIAVLKFELGDDASADRTAISARELLCETLTHYLARAGSLKVIAWPSSRSFPSASMPLPEIGEKLRADWLISGSCSVLGSRVIVTTQLIRAASQTIEHSERAAESIDDLLQPESHLAASLANSIVHCVTEAEAKRVTQHALPSLSSHSLLLGAVGLMHRSGGADFLRSKEALDHLLDRQPRMHSARPWLAKWYVLSTTRGVRQVAADDASRALSQTNRALDACSDDAFALAIQGFVHFHLKRDPVNARTDLKAAIGINPNEPLANIFYAAVVGANGDFEHAWMLAERALKLSPFDPLRAYMRMIASTCAFTSGRYEEAASLARHSTRENASHASAWRTLVIALIQGGRIDEGRVACERLLVVEPSLTLASYEKKLLLAEPHRQLAIDSLRIAGVPAN